jgi:hypothetical protein
VSNDAVSGGTSNEAEKLAICLLRAAHPSRHKKQGRGAISAFLNFPKTAFPKGTPDKLADYLGDR